MSWWNPIDDIKAVYHAVTHPKETVEDAYDYAKNAITDPLCTAWKLNPAFWGVVLEVKAAIEAGIIKNEDELKAFMAGVTAPLSAFAALLVTLPPAGKLSIVHCIWKEASEGTTENAIAHGAALGVASSALTGRIPALYVTSVSRYKDKLDIFSVASGGGVRTAAWEPAFTDW
jgi:hypothetical protein